MPSRRGEIMILLNLWWQYGKSSKVIIQRNISQMKKQDKITGKNIYELDIKSSKQWSNNVHETQEKNTEIQ